MGVKKGEWVVVGYCGDRAVILSDHRSEEAAAAQLAAYEHGGIEGYDRLTVEPRCNEPIEIEEEEVQPQQPRRTVLTLADAERRTPRVSAVEAMRQSLQLALFGAVSERDVAGMAEKLKEMALQGDLRAMKLFFALVQGPAQAGQVVNIQNAVVELQAAVAQIQQAVVVAPARPAPPQLAANGHTEG